MRKKKEKSFLERHPYNFNSAQLCLSSWVHTNIIEKDGRASNLINKYKADIPEFAQLPDSVFFRDLEEFMNVFHKFPGKLRIKGIRGYKGIDLKGTKLDEQIELQKNKNNFDQFYDN